MRKSVLAVAMTTLIWAAPVFAHDSHRAEDGVWHVRGDDGEIVKVLPNPAAAEDFEHRFGEAPLPSRINNYSVYSASYGTIPGQMNDHGGAVVSNAAFLPIFYNAAKQYRALKANMARLEKLSRQAITRLAKVVDSRPRD